MKVQICQHNSIDESLTVAYLKKMGVEVSDQGDVLITDYDLVKIRGSKIPVIIVTEFWEDWYKAEAFKAGAAYYLVKPVNFNDLKTIMKQLILNLS